ncbi:MAG TPA: carbohydrate ABC transporter permease [Actinotalea caeni]|uniref:carbohydrate ABC transporter permease n=1 Tax=Actinotalea caeni TaxID=1348467 RepID=UPI002B4B1FE6|nr:carbohydrate ABC transporter permease [Actinotalea caeni]HLV56113.1 carbohydrate ABC transporter permease [Actinotalea caeni]
MTSVRRRTRSERRSILLTALAVVVAALFILPALWLLSGSLRPSNEIFGTLSPVTWRTLVPSEVSLGNYLALLSGPFGRSILISFAVCFLTVAIGLVVSALAAYALSVLRFRGRGAVFAFVVISFMVPFEAIAIPLSQLFSGWGLTNTLLGLVLPGIGNGLAIFNLRQHFLSIPTSYREAATVDGAAEPRVLWSVYLPLGGAALANSALLIFLGQWSAYLWPLLVVSDSSLQVAPVALARTFGEYTFDFGQNFAGAIVLSVVPALMMFVLQRFFGGLEIASGEK